MRLIISSAIIIASLSLDSPANADVISESAEPQFTSAQSNPPIVDTTISVTLEDQSKQELVKGSGYAGSFSDVVNSFNFVGVASDFYMSKKSDNSIGDSLNHEVVSIDNNAGEHDSSELPVKLYNAVVAVPEPGMFALIAIAISGLAVRYLRRTPS